MSRHAGAVGRALTLEKAREALESFAGPTPPADAIRVRLRLQVRDRRGGREEVWEAPHARRPDGDYDPLLLQRATAWGTTGYAFGLESFDGEVATYRPHSLTRSSALYRRLGMWGFRRVEPS